jgi:hypothetical protein
VSSRERWIVFPLLFLSLGVSLRDKLVPPSRSEVVELHADSVVCRRLAVVDEANRVVVALGDVDAKAEALLRQFPEATVVAVGADGRRYGVFMKLPGLPQWHSMGPDIPLPRRASPRFPRHRTSIRFSTRIDFTTEALPTAWFVSRRTQATPIEDSGRATRPAQAAARACGNTSSP